MKFCGGFRAVFADFAFFSVLDGFAEQTQCLKGEDIHEKQHKSLGLIESGQIEPFHGYIPNNTNQIKVFCNQVNDQIGGDLEGNGDSLGRE